MVFKRLNDAYELFRFLPEHMGKLAILLKLLFFLLTCLVSYIWSYYLLDITVNILQMFDESITYTEAGPVFAFGILITPTLIGVLFFLPDSGTDIFPSQSIAHIALLSKGGVAKSRLAEAIRHDNELHYLKTSPDIVERELRIPLLTIPIFFVLLAVPIIDTMINEWIWFPSLTSLIASIILYTFSVLLLPFFIGTTVFRHREFRSWRRFWRHYWILVIMLFSSEEAVRSIMYSEDYSYLGPEYESLEYRLDKILDYNKIDPSALPSEWSEEESLEILNAFLWLESIPKGNNDIIQNPKARTALKKQLDYVTQYKEVHQVDEPGEFIRNAAIIISGFQLAELSIPALEDLMKLSSSQIDTFEVVSEARSYLNRINELPEYLVPKTWQWILIAYSIATTLSILLGPIFTQILLDFIPPS